MANGMTVERWGIVRNVLHQAMELPRNERPLFLDRVCADDSDLRGEVDSLLHASDGPDSLLDRPLLDLRPRLKAGDRIRQYQIVEEIGAGGMGTVYQARDTQLGRAVALKVLPAGAAADPEGQARFLREARAASALNHPNIVTIYDLVQEDASSVIVMEYVAGESLDGFIRRRASRLTDKLRLAIQVADALAMAHAKGIVHRDLKPANILMNQEGQPKIVDFGIAKLVQLPGAFPDVETSEGTVMGTAAYMSPEQAEAREIDARSDIFSFGSVLYELVTGKAAFKGGSAAASMSAVLRDEPPSVASVCPGAAPELSRLIARCLKKNPAHRFQHMADVRAALEVLYEDLSSGAFERAAVRPSRRWFWPAASAILLVAVPSLTVLYRTGPEPAPHLTRLSPLDEWEYSRPTISPDGKFVAYLSNRHTGFEQLWLQSTGSGEPVQLTHAVRGVTYPSFTPDGLHLVYRRETAGALNNAIEAIPLLGGSPRTIVEGAQILERPVVSPDGRLVAYIDGARGEVMTVPFAGGEPRPLAPIRSPDLAWAPDSQRLLFWTTQKSTTGEAIDDWAAVPLHGGPPAPTGMRAALEPLVGKVNSQKAQIMSTAGDRAIFRIVDGDQTHPWELRFSPSSLAAVGTPRQLTFGTERETMFTVNADGIAAIQARLRRSDLYLIPMEVAEGKPAGVRRRLTADPRLKVNVEAWHSPQWVTFRVRRETTNRFSLRHLESGKELPPVLSPFFVLTPDERQLVEWRDEKGGGANYASSLADPRQSQKLCSNCGRVGAPTPDPRFVQVDHPASEAGGSLSNSIHLLDLRTGAIQPWISVAGEAIATVREGFFGQAKPWIVISSALPNSPVRRHFVLPWRVPAPPRSEWIEVPQEAIDARVTAGSDLFFYTTENQLMTLRFDPRTRSFSGRPGPTGITIAHSEWAVSPRGLVQSETEVRSSVWLMKLPN